MPYVIDVIDDEDDDDEYCGICGQKREDYFKDRLIWMGTGKRRVLVRNHFVYHTCKYPSRTWITFWNCIREFGEGIKG